MKKKIVKKLIIFSLLIFVVINILWLNLYFQYNSLVKNKDSKIMPLNSANHSSYIFDPEFFSFEDQTVASVWVPKYLTFRAYVTIGNPMIISEAYEYSDDYTLTLRVTKSIFFKKEYSLEYADHPKGETMNGNISHTTKFKTDSDLNLIDPEEYTDDEIEIFQKHREEYVKYRDYFYDYFGEKSKKII